MLITHVLNSTLHIWGHFLGGGVCCVSSQTVLHPESAPDTTAVQLASQPAQTEGGSHCEGLEGLGCVIKRVRAPPEGPPEQMFSLKMQARRAGGGDCLVPARTWPEV